VLGTVKNTNKLVLKVGASIYHLCIEKQSTLITTHPMKKPMKTNVNAIGKKVALDTKELKALAGGFKDSVRTARELGSRAV
jgi:hypothetical protein